MLNILINQKWKLMVPIQVMLIEMESIKKPPYCIVSKCIITLLPGILCTQFSVYSKFFFCVISLAFSQETIFGYLLIIGNNQAIPSKG